MKKNFFPSISILSAGLLLLAGCSTQNTANVPVSDDMRFAKEFMLHQDGVRAFEIFREHAAKGDPEAEAMLGRCYFNGIGTEADPGKAYESFLKASAKNDPWALNGLGACYCRGIGTNMDFRRAFELFGKAAEMGHPLGTQNLALLYANPKAGFHDAKKAEEYFRKAVALKAPAAKGFYAEFLYKAGRYSEAVPLLKESLENPGSILKLALCCQNGWGTAFDAAEAVRLAEKYCGKAGASRECADIFLTAAYEEFLLHGDTEYARRCFRMAADQGNAEAQYYYSQILKDAKDKKGALRYMLKAADGGSPTALLEAGKILHEIKDYQGAERYFFLASQNWWTAQEALGYLSNIYHYDLKIPNTGKFWDVKGAALGVDFCRNELAFCELAQKTDSHFARAAALFAEGKANDNKCARDYMDEILKKDYERLRTLADKGNPDALFALGMNGILEKKDHPNIPIGLELLEKSGKLGNGAAYRMLGNAYMAGKTVKKDVKKSFSYYRKGVECGDADSAKFAALLIYAEDLCKTMKLEECTKVFEKALALEVNSIAYEYASVMEYFKQDPKKTEALYRIGASAGDGRAMLRLHEILYKTNWQESLDFLQQGLSSGYGEAFLAMGDLMRAAGCPRDAFSHYMRAAIFRNETVALCRLAECWLKGYGCAPNPDMFWTNAERSCKNGCAEVCFLLGNVYREGKICARDDAKAKAYFEEGAKRGNEECRKALKGL